MGKSIIIRTLLIKLGELEIWQLKVWCLLSLIVGFHPKFSNLIN